MLSRLSFFGSVSGESSNAFLLIEVAGIGDVSLRGVSCDGSSCDGPCEMTSFMVSLVFSSFTSGDISISSSSLESVPSSELPPRRSTL